MSEVLTARHSRTVIGTILYTTYLLVLVVSMETGRWSHFTDGQTRKLKNPMTLHFTIGVDRR